MNVRRDHRDYLAVLAIIAAVALAPPRAQAEQAAPDQAALLAFAQEPLTFDSFVFNGDQFPACQFEHPERVEKLIGPYKLKTNWYEAHGKTVTAPQKEAGRYAAVVEIQSGHRVSKRFFTLYHLQGNARFGLRADGAALTLPRGTAIEPDVVKNQADDVDYLATKAMTTALRKDPAGAALLAGLHELTDLRRAGKASDGDRASHRERQWWVDFKRRYYGYDKQYPERFVSPKPSKDGPAPVVKLGTVAEAGMKPDAVARIDAACETWLKANPVGFGLCVVRHGVVVVNKGYGQWQGKPVSAETPAVLASTTKFFAAIILLELIDQGLIGMDEPVEKYVPALRGIKVKRSMTVRDLYLHTAGFSGHDGDIWPDMEEIVADMYPALEVGVKHQYQGMGHALGSKIIEMMSGEALPYFYQNHLFGPLGCTRTTADFSAFGSSSISLDLAKIGQMMLNGGAYGDKYFFSRQTLAQMLPIKGRDRFPPDETIRWGVGIKLMDSDGWSEQAFGHSGAGGSFLTIDPAHDLVIAHARNSEGNSYKEFLKQKAKLIGAIAAAIDKVEKR